MITGIRANKDAQREFINKCLSDIRAEVVSSDIRTKAVAIEKAAIFALVGMLDALGVVSRRRVDVDDEREI